MSRLIGPLFLAVRDLPCGRASSLTINRRGVRVRFGGRARYCLWSFR